MIKNIDTYQNLGTPNTWTVMPNLSVGRCQLAGCGNINDALAFGGTTGVAVSSTDKWVTNFWVTANQFNGSARYALTGCGNISKALSIGGLDTSDTSVSTVEIWTGNSWGTFSSTLTVRHQLAACGNAARALCFGGYNTSTVKVTEMWSGTSWATTTVLNSEKYAIAGCGDINSALCFGGANTTDVISTTEIWSGSVWTSSSSQNFIQNLWMARYRLSGCGDRQDALSFGGWGMVEGTPAMVANTERWMSFSWATTTSLTHVRQDFASCGNVNEALIFGGSISSAEFSKSTERWYSFGY